MENQNQNLTLSTSNKENALPAPPTALSSGQDVKILKSRFLEFLRMGCGVKGAARSAGINSSTVYYYRRTDSDFAREWDEVYSERGETVILQGQSTAYQVAAERKKKLVKETFLKALYKTYSAKVSAKVAGVSKSSIYKYRREDPEFAKEWDQALKTCLDAVNEEGMRRGVYGITKKVHGRGNLSVNEKFMSDKILCQLLKFSFRKRFELIEADERKYAYQGTDAGAKLLAYLDEIEARNKENEGSEEDAKNA